VYTKDLAENQGYDYALMEMRWVEMQPDLAEIQKRARIAERMAMLP
jgi:hypothetical protein